MTTKNLNQTYATSDEQASAIRGRVVCQPDLHSELGQLMGISGRNDAITVDLGVGNLRHNVLVREAHNEAVLGGVVLVLVLNNEAANFVMSMGGWVCVCVCVCVCV